MKISICVCLFVVCTYFVMLWYHYELCALVSFMCLYCYQ
jgi:hypothetical protein